MIYDIEFKPRAVKDLKGIPKAMQKRILTKIELMQDNLKGDVKRLTDSAPEYRLRVGDYRVLFEVEDATIIIYRIVNRKDAY